MFVGEYSHTIDEKGRLAIPRKMRHELAAGAVVTRGVDRCLFVYAKEEWMKLAEKISNLPLANPKARSFARQMLAGAMEVETDGQGRVLVPGYLRTYASLKADVVVAGVYNRIELWDEAAWKAYQAEQSVEEDIAALEI